MLQTASKHSTTIQATTKSVHAETVRVVEEQMQDLDEQMRDLDDFVSRAKAQNATHQERHAESVRKLDAAVEQSFSNISGHFKETSDRVQHLGEEMDAEAQSLGEALGPLEEEVRRPLAELREEVQNTEMREYEPTGQTPEKREYAYPTTLPRTEPHEALLAALRDSPTPKASPAVLPDQDTTPVRSPSRPAGAGADTPCSTGLREVDPNLGSATKTNSILFESAASILSPPAPNSSDAAVPLLKSTANTKTRPSRLAKKVGGLMVGDGAENLPPPPVLRSSTRRKSPRLH